MSTPEAVVLKQLQNEHKNSKELTVIERQTLSLTTKVIDFDLTFGSFNNLLVQYKMTILF